MTKNIKLLVVVSCYLLAFVSNDLKAETSTTCTGNAYEIRTLERPDVLYLKVNDLCDDLTKALGDSLRKFFKEHPAESIEGSVLDLRQTKPISRNATVSGLASLFIYPGTLISTFQNANGQYLPIKTGRNYYQTNNEEDYLHGLPEFLREAPVAVLVSKETRGAPEDLASILLDERNATLLGEEFEGGIGNSIDLQNPFYQLIASSFPITTVQPVAPKRYIYQDSVEPSNNCSEEQLSYLINQSHLAVVRVVKYPRNAQIRAIEGEGTLAVLVDKSGKLMSQWILKSTGDDALDIEMLSAGQKAKFSTTSCITDSVLYRFPIIFNLEN